MKHHAHNIKRKKACPVISYFDLMEVEQDEQVVVVLAPRDPRMSNRNKRFVIFQGDLWKFSEEHNEDFEKHMYNICLKVLTLFDLLEITTKRRMVQLMSILAELIQETIVDWMDTIPDSSSDADKLIVGEGTITLGNQNIDVGITESGLMVVQ